MSGGTWMPMGSKVMLHLIIFNQWADGVKGYAQSNDLTEYPWMVTVTGIERTLQKSKEKDLGCDIRVIMSELQFTTVIHYISQGFSLFRNATYSSVRVVCFVVFVVYVSFCWYSLYIVLFFRYPKKICFNVYCNHGDNLPSEIYQSVVIITKQDIQNYINLISIIFNIL